MVVNAIAIVDEDGGLELALKKLSNRVEKGGTLNDLRRHKAFAPKSERRRKKSALARARQRRNGRHIQDA